LEVFQNEIKLPFSRTNDSFYNRVNNKTGPCTRDSSKSEGILFVILLFNAAESSSIQTDAIADGGALPLLSLWQVVFSVIRLLLSACIETNKIRICAVYCNSANINCAL
jgi:hypothetical protein